MKGTRIGARGATGPGGGADLYLREPALQRGSTAQVKGLYPFTGGAGSTIGVGAPLGPVLRRDGRPSSGAIFCADPITWFEKGRLISNPSATVVAMPGIGKSTLIRRMLLILAYWGCLPWVMLDLKGEYQALVEGLGGAVIPVGRGRGAINVLDLGEAPSAAARLTAAGHKIAGDALLADAKARRQTGVEALISVQRGSPPTELECIILGVALAELHGTPLLGDLLHLIENPSEAVKDAGMGQSDVALRTSLRGLVSEAGLGAVFSRPTTVGIDRDRALVFDTSGIDRGEPKLRAATALTCWTTAFGALAVSHALEDAGLDARRRQIITTDEAWDILLSSPGLVQRYNGLARLNRQEGVGTLDAFHSLADLEAFDSVADRTMARGMIEKKGMLFIGGVPRAEIERMRAITHFTEREAETVVGWSTPPTLHTIPGRKRTRPGEGNWLLKVGDGADLPGIPFHLQLTAAELTGINDTDKRWSTS